MARRTRPRSLEELLVAIQEQIRRIDNRPRLTVGSGGGAYVLEVGPTGELTARHTRTGKITVLAVP